MGEMHEDGEQLRKAPLSATAFDAGAADDPPARARAVVIGGGIIGAAVAFHLAALGWREVIVLERHRLTSGTTWHAAGLVTRTRPTHVTTELASYSRDFYKGLAGRSGIDVGYHESGSLTLAQTEARMIELDYAAAMAQHHGLPAAQLSPEEIAVRFPLVDPDGLVGGVLYEGDATVNPGVAALATAKAAFDSGVRFFEGVDATGFTLDCERRGARIAGVETSRGGIECEVAVIAAGLWSRDLALLAGARVPLQPVQHVWMQTEPFDGATRALPIIRDLDSWFYARHYRGGLVIGVFAPGATPRSTASIPSDFEFGEFEADWEHVEAPLAAARRRLPAARDAAVTHFLNAPESFTPDGVFLIGETAEVAGLYVAAGLNSQGIIFGPGVGRALAEWIDTGSPTVDAAGLDVRRFSPAQNNERYLLARGSEALARLYTMHWPHLQSESARGLRRVPLHDRLAAHGAVFGETTGWERAHWFALPGEAGEYRYSWGRPDWFDAAGREHRAARQAVALFDLSSIGKFLIEGPNALQTVQHVFSADLDRPPGTITYTCLLNQRGGVEADLTVTRLAEQSFLAVVPTTTQNRTCHWLRRHAAEQTVIRDVTNGLGTLGVMGPGAAGLLSALTGASLDDAAFPYGTARWIEIGWVNILALRVSFVGELGWELYAPVEQCVTLFDQLIAAGAEHDLRLAGYHALDSLRAEKGFLHWGADVGPADTPFEAGIGFTVALDKQGGFVGREALAARFHGPRAEAAQSVSSGGRPGDRPPSAGRRDTARMLVKLRLDHPEQLLYHGESLLLDDRVIGRVTSGAYGFTLGCAVGLAFLEAPPEEIEATLTARAVEVDCAGVRVPATIGRQPFYDPEGLRMRASAGIA